MRNLYKEHIMDHYHNPRNRGTISAPDFTSGMHNPLCGDAVTIQGSVSQKKLVSCSFQAQGCVISQAAASMLLERINGQTIAEIEAYCSQDILDMIGIALGPTRLKCALLPLEALKRGLKDHA